MKILLTKDVRKIGQRGQIVEVSEGYGRNFLIKQGLGRAAVGGILKEAKNKESAKKGAAENKIEKELKLLSKINKEKFIMTANASDKGHLFAAIHKKEIAKTIGVDEKNINLNTDIKELGEFNITVNLGGKKGKIILCVEKN